MTRARRRHPHPTVIVGASLLVMVGALMVAGLAWSAGSRAPTADPTEYR
jgi:hypothetical protein